MVEAKKIRSGDDPLIGREQFAVSLRKKKKQEIIR